MGAFHRNIVTPSPPTAASSVKFDRPILPDKKIGPVGNRAAAVAPVRLKPELSSDLQGARRSIRAQE